MRSVVQSLLDKASSPRTRTAIVDPDGREWSHRELYDSMRAACGCVRQQTAPTSTVLLRQPSGGHLWASLVATVASGRDALLLAPDAPDAVLQRVASDVGTLVEFDEDWLQASATGSFESDGPLGGIILHSSGTTGRSRLVRRTPEAVDLVAVGLVQADLYRSSDIVASCLPMQHAYGFEHALLAPILSGCTLRCSRTFDVEQVRESCARGVTVMPTVGPALDALLRAGVDASGLRHAIVAGSSLAESLRKRWAEAGHCPLVDLYGATEVGTIWLDWGRGGVAMPGVELRLLDPQQTEALAPVANGEIGEVAVRTRQMAERIVCQGSERLEQDGWFRTGDLARQDDHGCWRLVGRSKLLFDVGGLKVNPIEVEFALCEHPAIAAAVVAPVDVGGVTRVSARLEARSGCEWPSSVELREFLRSQLPPHAIPRDIAFVDRLPRTGSGKVLRASGPGAAAEVHSISPVRSRSQGLSRRADREDWTRKLFGRTAREYDSASAVASLGTGHWYRRKLLKGFGLKAGMSVLDVGSGTGVCASIAQAIVTRSGRVVALDPSREMLDIADRRGVSETVVGFAEALPFGSETFDFVTMSYMLRHVEDLHAAFAEARRVLRPGGRLLVFELSPPETPVLRWAFRHLMGTAIPFATMVVSRRASTFGMMRYWGRTMDVAVPQNTILDAMQNAGLLATRCYTEIGVFHCYRGVAPLRPGATSGSATSAAGTDSTSSPAAMVASLTEALTSNRYSAPNS